MQDNMITNVWRAKWLLAAVPFFGISTGALFPIIAMQLDDAGFKGAFIGLITTLYYAGSFCGTIGCGAIVRRIGYKPSFAIVAGLAAITTYALTLTNDPAHWLILRFIGGFALGAYYIVVDSWVAALGTKTTRGRLYAVYETIRLISTALGPMLIVIGAGTSALLIVLVGYAVSFIPALCCETPVAASRDHKPGLAMISIIQCFPFVLVIAFCSGIANASFYGLSLVFANGIGLSPATTATFIGLVLIAPAVTEIPTGILADRFRRMTTALTIACIAGGATISMVALSPTTFWTIAALGIIVGGCMVPLYALAISRIVDSVGEHQAIDASTTASMVYNFGAFAGPVSAGTVMEIYGPSGLYVFLSGIACLAAIAAVIDMMHSTCCAESAAHS